MEWESFRPIAIVQKAVPYAIVAREIKQQYFSNQPNTQIIHDNLWLVAVI